MYSKIKKALNLKNVLKKIKLFTNNELNDL